MGQPTKLTPKLQAAIRANVAAGNYIETACLAAGISTTTYYNWMKWGEQGKEPYVGFFASLKAAEAEAEAKALKCIENAMMDSWQAAAWYLERTKHRKFGKTLQHEGGDPSHPMRMTVSIVDFNDDTDGDDSGDEAAEEVPE